MKKETQYICETCGTKYTNENEASLCERRHKECPCLHSDSGTLLYKVIGYGRAIHSYISFKSKKIITHYDHACDSGNDYSTDIKYCPLCGREL